MTLQSSDVMEVFREIHAQRGYIVIGTKYGSRKFNIGDQVEKLYQFEIMRPWLISSLTDEKDLETQLAFLENIRPTWKRLGQMIGGYYYRVLPLERRKSERIL